MLNLDILINRELSILSNETLLMVHGFTFIIFQIVNINYFNSKLFHGALGIFDSFAKAKSITSSIKETYSFHKNLFIKKMLIAIIATQFNKYIFERFLINSREENSWHKTMPIALCTILLSSDFINYTLNTNEQIIFGATIILFIGQNLVNLPAKKYIQQTKQGLVVRKLPKNA